MQVRFYLIVFLGICLVIGHTGCGGGTIENDTPKINITQPAGDDDSADTSFVLTWTDKDSEDDAQISFYYDTDNTGFDGILITEGISEDGTQDYYSWDTALIAEGTYYIYAVIDDGVNVSVRRYSGGTLVVTHDPLDNIAPVITVTEPDGSSDLSTTSYVIKWTDADPDDNALISLYYDSDNSGNDGTLITAGLSEDSGGDSYTWDTSAVPEGKYYIYAEINDGSSVYDYSSGQVTIWDGSVDVGAADVQINTDSSGSKTSEAQQIAASGDYVYVLWSDFRDGNPDIYFNYSTDQGETWGASDKRLNTNAAGTSYSTVPQITASGDYVYAVWEDRRNGSYYDIYLAYSSNRGVTWSTPDVRLDTDTAGSANSRNPVICCSGNNVYVAWQDYRAGRWEIYFNYSSDGGQNFQASDLRVDTDDVGDSTYPKITCSTSNVFITWEDTRYGSNPDTFFNFVK